MKLRAIENDPVTALRYLDRCVNNGLPGGTRFLNNVSKMTNPWSVSSFQCGSVMADPDRVIEVGTLPTPLTGTISKEEFLIHPDTINDYLSSLEPTKQYTVVPTSSARTVYVSGTAHYVKMHYPLILGRVSKALTKNDLMNSFYNTELLSRLISVYGCMQQIAFFPEPYSKYSPALDLYNIWRSTDPVMHHTLKSRVRYIIPAFSLFGRDWEEPNDITLIAQLMVEKKGVGINPLKLLICPIISCYLTLLFQCGLQIEMHSQNFMAAFDSGWQFLGIILRDIDSIQHDLSIMRSHGLDEGIFQKYGRCFDETDPDCKIKRSFMFDHKFGEFFLLPILSEISNRYDVPLRDLTEEIKQFCRSNYSAEFDQYFPHDEWYKFKDILIRPGIKRRIYTRCKGTIFR